MPPDEPLDVRCLRWVLHRWPIRRGKSAVMRLVGPWVKRRRFVMEVEPGIGATPDLDDRVVWWCFVDGSRSWEPIMELSRALIAPGDTVIDIGAHVGFWVMGAALRAGPGGRVVAFEPVESNMVRLHRNLAINGLGFVTCERWALADRRGAADFYPAVDGNEGAGSFGARPGGRRVSVPVTTLDDYCAERGITSIAVLKIDVEGAEHLVLLGAARALSSPQPPVIMFEANDAVAAPFGHGVAEVKRLLAQHGYRAYRYDGARLLEVASDEPHRGEDLLALVEFHFARYPRLARLRHEAHRSTISS